MKKRKEFNNKGITLIALVITIIILIILAGVSINIVLGENGLINKAKEAKETSTIKSIQEKLELVKGTSYIEGKGSNSIELYLYCLDKEKIEPYKVTNITILEKSLIIEVDEKYEFLIEFKGNGNIEIIYQDDNEIQVGPNTPTLDTINPEEAIIEISGETTVTSFPATLSAKVTHSDNESGINIQDCRYILNTSSDSITDTSTYTGTFNENEESIPLELTSVAEYYLHVLSVDNEGNETETIKGPISVTETYHTHLGSSASKGGCYTKEKYETQSVTCGFRMTARQQGHDWWWYCDSHGAQHAWTQAELDNMGISSSTIFYCGQKTSKSVLVGYNLGCGKTTSTVESYTITY